MLRSNIYAKHHISHAFNNRIDESVTLENNLLSKLSQLSQHQQWILFTAECPRPKLDVLSSYHIAAHKVIHIKASQYQSELEIIIKAIESGNASAIVASKQIPVMQQALLKSLAKDHQCEVFFVAGSMNQYH
jgi:cell division inhibitor SulA